MVDPAPKSTRSAWLALPWTLAAFPVAVSAGFGVFAAFGLCMDDSREVCAAAGSPWPSWWHLLIIFVIGFALLSTPSFVALKLGLAARRSGNPKAIRVIVASVALPILIAIVLSNGIW